jgi:hypothetical protein
MLCDVLSLPSTAEGLLINFNASQHEVKKWNSLSNAVAETAWGEGKLNCWRRGGTKSKGKWEISRFLR